MKELSCSCKFSTPTLDCKENNTQVSETALAEYTKKKVSYLSGEEIWPMLLDISLPQLSTSPLKMPYKENSSKELTLTPKKKNSS